MLIRCDWLINLLCKLVGFKIKAITIIFIIIAKKNVPEYVIKHEKIHIKQWFESFIIFFPIISYGHYFYNRIFKKMNHYTAYINICFEKEARENQSKTNYQRKNYNWLLKR